MSYSYPMTSGDVTDLNSKITSFQTQINNNSGVVETLSDKVTIDSGNYTSVHNYFNIQINDLISKYYSVAQAVSRTPSTKILDSRLSNLESVVKGLSKMTTVLTQNTNSRPTLADLKRTETALEDLISKNSSAIQALEVRLSKVLLPNETKYYLETGEIDEFKATFAKLKAMMAKFEALYKNLVAYTVNN